jgi:SAM-dependent methyltransferase
MLEARAPTLTTTPTSTPATASQSGEEAELYNGPRRKQLGIYLTPLTLAHALTRQALAPLLESDLPLSKIIVLDPACGAGALLLAAWRLIEQAYTDRGQALSQDPDQREEAMARHLRGVDFCPQMIAIARSSLRLEARRGGRGHRLAARKTREVHGPAPLSSPSVLAAGDGLGRAENSPEARALLDMSYPCILANPPYVLAQEREDGQRLQTWAKERFVSATYKVDTSLLFIERCLELLDEDGHLAILTPNSWLKNKHAAPLRKLLLEEHRINALLSVTFNAFPRASVETIITHIQRSDQRGESDKSKVLLADILEDGALEERARLEQASWRSRADHAISLEGGDDTDAREHLDELTRGHIRLDAIARVYFGLQTRSRKSWVATTPPEDGRSWKPCLDGKQLEPFAARPPSEFVCTAQEAIKSGGKSEVHGQERIGVRQIGATPIAALIPEDVWSLNTVYNIYLTDEALATGYDTRYLLGVILSSTVQQHWLQHASDHKRIFPKVKKAALRALPIPPIDFTASEQRGLHDEVVASVERLRELREQSWEGDEDGAIEAQFSSEQENLDALIVRCFEILAE